jgi:hypothetical protein
MALAKLNHNYLDPLKVSNEIVDGILSVSSKLSVPSISAPSGTVSIVGNISASGIFSGSGAGLTNIPNGALTNSSVTINGTSVSLGGSISIIALPAQSAGTTGYYLQSNGTSASWVALGLAAPAVAGTMYGYSSSQFANTGVGYQALQNNNGAYATALGNAAGFSNNGSWNTFLGNSAGTITLNGSYNIIIGGNVQPSSSSVSGEVTIGDTNVTSFRMPGVGINFTRTSNLIQSQATTQIPLSIQGIASQTASLQNWLNSAGTVVGSIDNSGNLVAAGDITTNSDSRLKDNIEKITDALAIVDQINGVTYSLISDDKKIRHVGLIAQDVEAVMPEAVLENENGIKSVAYGNLVGLLVEAIKELRAEVTELRGIIDGI